MVTDIFEYVMLLRQQGAHKKADQVLVRFFYLVNEARDEVLKYKGDRL